jgi:hypothetical protein
VSFELGFERAEFNECASFRSWLASYADWAPPGRFTVIQLARPGRPRRERNQFTRRMTFLLLLGCNGDVDRLKALAKHLAGGLEPELSIAVDVMFPMATLTAAVTAFHAAFPLTPLRLYAETLGAVMQSVLDERCTIGLSGQLASAPPLFT